MPIHYRQSPFSGLDVEPESVSENIGIARGDFCVILPSPQNMAASDLNSDLCPTFDARIAEVEPAKPENSQNSRENRESVPTGWPTFAFWKRGAISAQPFQNS